MGRQAFMVLSALSLVLCLATGVLWAVSYRQFIDVGRISTSQDATTSTQHLIRLGSNNGRFLFTRRDIIWPRPDKISGWEKQKGWYLTRQPRFDIYRNFHQPGDRSWDKNIAGLRFTRAVINDRFRNLIGIVLYMPHAYVCAALAVLPAFATRHILRRRRASRRGLCQKCL